ncbi:hypothetical protein DL89DRAFT_105145 [Linderina pennispora]|uniref:Uncharacterized protein n=1 Tax=Linderina pennispora TaxID=61395 RepID=A0A1Y1WEM8_9FUNG|nr:uncharacterized protein DL89DRAFT_105145 [Linderina pennispora]ORX71981.1 hypothetical protein DL89DRAFT_105145 [Linderina pennispora]
MPTFLGKGCPAIQLSVLEQISTDEEPSASNSQSSHTDKYDLPVGQDYLRMGKPQGATKYEDLCHSVVDPELNTGLGLTHRFFNVQDVTIIHRLGENPSVHREGFHNPAFHVLSPGDGGSGDGGNELGDGGDGPGSGVKSDDGGDGEKLRWR